MLAPLQAKMLRVFLPERQFERVGGNHPIKVDVRLIAATHRDLEAMVKSGAFRQDLYYRLNVVAVSMPALREHRERYRGVGRTFHSEARPRDGTRGEGNPPEARGKLRDYDWPGNVRELENAIERALVLGSSDFILPEDLPDSVAESGSCTQEASGDFHEQVKQAKKQIVLRVLEQAGKDYNEAARRLGLHPSNLYRLVRGLDLKA